MPIPQEKKFVGWASCPSEITRTGKMPIPQEKKILWDGHLARPNM